MLAFSSKNSDKMTLEEIRKELANQKAELVRQHEEAPQAPEIAGLIIDQARKICAEEVTSRGKDNRLGLFFCGI